MVIYHSHRVLRIFQEHKNNNICYTDPFYLIYAAFFFVITIAIIRFLQTIWANYCPTSNTCIIDFIASPMLTTTHSCTIYYDECFIYDIWLSDIIELGRAMLVQIWLVLCLISANVISRTAKSSYHNQLRIFKITARLGTLYEIRNNNKIKIGARYLIACIQKKYYQQSWRHHM